MSRYWSLFVAFSVVAVSTSLAERMCMPGQWEADVVGKIAHMTDGQFLNLDVVGKAAADYSRGMTALLQSVSSQGRFVGKYLFLSLQVMGTPFSCLNVCYFVVNS